jgi:hypothetical protein
MELCSVRLTRSLTGQEQILIHRVHSLLVNNEIPTLLLRQHLRHQHYIMSPLEPITSDIASTFTRLGLSLRGIETNDESQIVLGCRSSDSANTRSSSPANPPVHQSTSSHLLPRLCLPPPRHSQKHHGQRLWRLISPAQEGRSASAGPSRTMC